MKTIVTIAAAIAATLVLASIADARPRVVVNKRPPISLLPQHPFVFQAMLEADLCRKVAWSVPPEVPPGSPRLGKCPHRCEFSLCPR